MRGLGTDHVISATALLTPPIIFFGQNALIGPKKNPAKVTEKKKIVSLHGNIRRTRFDQKSPQSLEEGVLNGHRHTDTQTDRHTDRRTW